MSDGLFKPLVGMKAAKQIHTAGFDVNIYLDHARRKSGPVKYEGDEERRQGMTCKVTIDFTSDEGDLDEIVAQRDKLREMGFDTEYEYNNFRLVKIL